MEKVILITGASSGIGKATAVQLIKEGYIVYAAARRTNKMEDLKTLGGHILPLDITDHTSVKNVVAQIIKEQGRIDVLFNNAGYGVNGAIEDVELADARQQFEVNNFGLADLTKEVLPFMRQQGGGKIINTSSMSGKLYAPLSAWYHASKHALEGWSDCLRLEVKQFNIDVVIIEPGVIATAFADVSLEPMMQRSASGVYAKMAQQLAVAAEKFAKEGQQSPATVIADVVSTIIRARKPKRRYIAGKFAKPAIFVRKWFGDKVYDKIVMSHLK